MVVAESWWALPGSLVAVGLATWWVLRIKR